ncbi:MAG: HDOD domain-containing protein [Pseudomonadota bacterium]
MTTPRELVEQTTDLFSLPEVYLQVKAVVEDPGASSADVADAISIDPGLTARLLKIANCPLFGCVAKMDSVERAVNLLGMQQVHYLTLATTAATSFKSVDVEGFSMYHFWTNSVYSATVANLLGVRSRSFDSGTAFVAGLLRDIGHLVMYQTVPEKTNAARLAAQTRGIPLAQSEREILGFDYTQIGAQWVQCWQLPDSLYEAIHYQCAPTLASRHQQDAAIMYLSARGTEAWSEGDLETPEEWAIDQLVLDIVEMNLDDVKDVASDAATTAVQTLDLLMTRQAAA